MILSDHGELTPIELARELLRERDVLHRHSRRLRELQERVTDYERGDLAETDEVCDWIMDYDLVLRVEEENRAETTTG